MSCSGFVTGGPEWLFDLVLGGGSVAALRAHKARQNTERLPWGSACVESGLVFTRENGVTYSGCRAAPGYRRYDSTITITADTHASVLAEVARSAAEAAARVVPRGQPANHERPVPSRSIRLQRRLRRPAGAEERPGQDGWAPWGSNPQPAD
jgi:hypothetical protein